MCDGYLGRRDPSRTGSAHRYRKSQNRLLKVCCVPATSASLPRVSFFFSFLFLLQWPFTVLIKQGRQYVLLSSLYILRCLWFCLYCVIQGIQGKYCPRLFTVKRPLYYHSHFSVRFLPKYLSNVNST